MGEPPQSTSANTIVVTVPTRTEFASTLRVLVASIGADANFSVDEIDDLRLAVSEVFTSMVETAGSEHCSVSFTLADSSITVAVALVGSDAPPVQLDPLASTILATVVDEFDVHPHSVTVVKRARESAAQGG